MGGEGKQGVGTPRAWEPETPRPRGTPQEEDWGAVGLAPLSPLHHVHSTSSFCAAEGAQGQPARGPGLILVPADRRPHPLSVGESPWGWLGRQSLHP